MDLKLRPGTPDDAQELGRICYEAFNAIAKEHTFAPDVPEVDIGVGLISMLLGHPGFYAVVAEADGKVVGSNFLDERSTIAGVGPVTVDPAVQDKGGGAALMRDVMRRAEVRGAPGIRLLQSAYHNRALALYAKLGFQARDLLGCMQGPALSGEIPGYQTRAMTSADAEACNALCMRVHGHNRAGEVSDAIKQGTGRVVEHHERISGYATDLGFVAHAVGESNEELKALILAADAFGGSGILVPATNADLFRWCLEQRLQVVQVMTLMTIGLYNRPDGAYMPSISY
jgi:GNAT superfamily N-acetyltransferase